MGRWSCSGATDGFWQIEESFRYSWRDGKALEDGLEIYRLAWEFHS